MLEAPRIDNFAWAMAMAASRVHANMDAIAHAVRDAHFAHLYTLADGLVFATGVVFRFSC